MRKIELFSGIFDCIKDGNEIDDLFKAKQNTSKGLWPSSHEKFFHRRSRQKA